jgi:hypothetical protein
MKNITWIAMTAMMGWCDSLGDGCAPKYAYLEANSSTGSTTSSGEPELAATSDASGTSTSTSSASAGATGATGPGRDTTQGVLEATGIDAASTSTSTGQDTTGTESGTTEAPVPCGPGGWRVKSVLFADGGMHGDWFGISLSVEPSGWLIVGAQGTTVQDKSFAGAVHAFTRNGDDWTPGAVVVSKTPGSCARFGMALDLTANKALIGEPGVAPGGAHIFRDDWTLEQSLPGKVDDHSFGGAVAIDGDLAVVGTWLDDIVRPYHFTGVSWVAETTLMNGENSRFGQTLDLRGGLLAIGDETGDSVSIYRREGNLWVFEDKVAVPGPIGVALALDNAPADLELSDDRLLFASTMDAQGKVYVFRRHVFVDMASWYEDAVIPVDGEIIADESKSHVSVVGTSNLLVGVKGPWKGPGKAMFFDHKGQSWVGAGYLDAPGYEQSEFGTSVGMLDETHILVGAPLEENEQGLPGAVYELERCST